MYVVDWKIPAFGGVSLHYGLSDGIYDDNTINKLYNIQYPMYSINACMLVVCCSLARTVCELHLYKIHFAEQWIMLSNWEIQLIAMASIIFIVCSH